MKTGIELIAEERREQIEKHGWPIHSDRDYARGQLLQAAEFCLDQARRQQTDIGVDIQTWPEGWLKHFEGKIRSKSVIQQYIVAGAFYLAEHDRTGDDYSKIINQIAAEIDRLQTKNSEEMKGLNNIVTRLHESAVKKGFWDEKREIGTLLMLVVSELSEALEADRKNRFANLQIFENCIKADDIKEEDKECYLVSEFQRNIKDTFEDEIADTFIRLFDLCGALNLDIEKHIGLKMWYNQSREYKHGKKY